MKSLGVCYKYVEVPECWYQEHGLEYITFYIRKHSAPLVVCSGPPAVHKKQPGASAFERLANYVNILLWPGYS